MNVASHSLLGWCGLVHMVTLGLQEKQAKSHCKGEFVVTICVHLHLATSEANFARPLLCLYFPFHPTIQGAQPSGAPCVPPCERSRVLLQTAKGSLFFGVRFGYIRLEGEVQNH